MDLLFLPISNIINKKIEIIEKEPETPKPSQTKNYVKRFIEKNKDKIYEKTTCPICYSKYTYFNKSKHFKTKRHITMMNVKNNSNN